MNDKATPAVRQFQGEIYRDLEQKLKNSPWNSGASEAHGLLTALACRGVAGERLRTKAWLLQLSAAADIDLIEGLYGLILRDLQSDDFQFNLLLPDDSFSDDVRIESLADWCDGFVQGFFHDGLADDEKDGVPERVRESINDIMEISRIDVNVDEAEDAEDAEATERQLVEIEEYLRVAIQVIFEEMGAAQPKTH